MKRFQYFIFTGIVFLGAILFSKPVFAATNFQFSPTKVTVKEGETFTVQTTVIPSKGKNYTVKLELEFPPEMLSIKSWSYGDNWMPVRKTGYDLLNNDKGHFIRTAGYPEGFDSATVFGTITLYARKSGEAMLRINKESFIFDQNGKNIATLPGPFSVQIHPSTVVPVPQEVEKKVLPVVNSKQTVTPTVAPAPVQVSESSTPVKELIPIEQNSGVLPTNDIPPVEEVSPVLVEPVKPVEVLPVPAVQNVKKQVTPSRSFDFSSFLSSDDSLLLLLITALIFVLIAISREVANMPNNKLRINRP